SSAHNLRNGVWWGVNVSWIALCRGSVVMSCRNRIVLYLLATSFEGTKEHVLRHTAITELRHKVILFTPNGPKFPQRSRFIKYRRACPQAVPVFPKSPQTLPYFPSLCFIVEKDRGNPGSSRRVAAGSLPDPILPLLCLSAAYPLPTRYPPRSVTVEAEEGAEKPGQAGNDARLSLFRNPSRSLSGPFCSVSGRAHRLYGM
ncbi:MAG TPA: hypothetical protein VH593_26210, partial [Ktedonobacteraceae bacterium]